MNRQLVGTLLLTLLMACGLVVSGCSSAAVYQMDAGERTAGAEGQVSVTQDNNGNNLINLTVAHLPQPSRLDESMGTFVVWIKPQEGNMHYNVGQLRLDRNRTGTLNFTSPFPTFEMMVTAEADGRALSPSNQVVLRRGIGGR